MRYQLYYWPEIQGRGEFVRLAFEDAGIDYSDECRLTERGMTTMMRLIDGRVDADLGVPFAPPFIRANRLLISQTPAILQYLGERYGLAPKSVAGARWTHQLQLTVADFVQEIHDTHHPLGPSFFYEHQRPQARLRTQAFWIDRAPKYLGYFERALARKKARYINGARASTVDLSLFQLVAGLRYAFPRRMGAFEPEIPRLLELHERVSARPNIRAYLNSKRRIPFNEDGIFRHYKALDR